MKNCYKYGDMPSYFAHPSAIIEPGSRIGRDSRVWAFAHVMSKSRIGSCCNIGNYVFVESGASLADNVTVKNGVQVWEGVRAHKGVFIGPGVVFTNHLLPRAFIKQPKSAWLRPTVLKEGGTLGARSTILCGITIGQYAFVAAGSLVTRSVPDFALVAGSPAVFRSWRCYCGRPLIFQGPTGQCRVCRERFQIDTRGTQIRPLHPRKNIQQILSRRLRSRSRA